MNFMTPEERNEMMATVRTDMLELIRTDEKIRDRIKSRPVNEVYDLLRSIFFTDADRCIYDERLPYYAFHRRYANEIKAKLRYDQNKMLGVKTQCPDNFCIGLVLSDEIEMVPEPEHMTYLQAVRKVKKLLKGSEYPTWELRYNIYRIEDDGTLTVM